jgi:uncharacterized iron-regulated membrane protein
MKSPSMPSEKVLHAPETGNRRLAQLRRWHKWGGLIAGLFLLVLAATGILLNYKQPIFSALGIPTKRERDVSPLPQTAKPAGVSFSTDGIAGGKVTFEQALALAKNEWGDAAIERAEIRAEQGGVTFRFRNDAGEELWVDAADGRHAVKGEYERISRSESEGKPARSTDWGKMLIDLHTGRIGGEAGKIVMSLVALVLLFLTASGVYMWAKPLLICSQKRYARIAQIPASKDLVVAQPQVDSAG